MSTVEPGYNETLRSQLILSLLQGSRYSGWTPKSRDFSLEPHRRRARRSDQTVFRPRMLWAKLKVTINKKHGEDVGSGTAGFGVDGMSFFVTWPYYWAGSHFFSPGNLSGLTVGPYAGGVKHIFFFSAATVAAYVWPSSYLCICFLYLFNLRKSADMQN